MKPYSLDEHWERLALECHCAGIRIPRAARLAYRGMLALLRWLTERAARRNE